MIKTRDIGHGGKFFSSFHKGKQAIQSVVHSAQENSALPIPEKQKFMQSKEGMSRKGTVREAKLEILLDHSTILTTNYVHVTKTAANLE